MYMLRLSIPSVVTTGEQFTVVCGLVNAGGGEFSAPSFKGFYKIMGPQTSYSSSTQIINGKVSNKTSYSYVYYLQAVNEGKFTLAPATFTLKNKTYSSDSLHIDVVSGGSQKQSAAPAGSNDENNNADVESEGKISL